MNGHDEDALRKKMKTYWKVYQPSLESMMLSSDAMYLHENEQNEIFSYLPNYQGKRVLELGAGIGRFTSKLATVASHVTAVDFMSAYIEKNKASNQHLENVAFKCADVTKLDFPAGSFDLVFSNWLFMYLGDEETFRVFNKVINWLSPGGHFFLRESCYHQSGNMKRDENPTLYRTPLQYCQLLHQVSPPSQATFKIIRGKSILTYIQYHGNPNQLCFLAQRVDGKDSHQLKRYLESRDTVEVIRATERVYGNTWLSTGGEYTTRGFCARLGLVPGQRVVDVGCGTGGSAIYLARNYGLHVHGVDLSTNMIHIAIERQGKLEPELKKRLQFEISDILTVDYEADCYDVIYSRDSLLFIADKALLFQKLYRWLRPGGTLFFTDLCSGPATPSRGFLHDTRSVQQYSLVSMGAYEAHLTDAGFEEVKVEDLGHEFVKMQETELSVFSATREAFIKDYSEELFDAISKKWTNKIRWSRENQLTWGAFTARKATHAEQ